MLTKSIFMAVFLTVPIALSAGPAAGGDDEAGGGNLPPTVGFAQPLDGQVFEAGVNLDVVVDADDPDGSVANVELYLDGQYVRRENRSPYGWAAGRDAEFQNMAPGTYTLTAVATDDLGAKARTSASITIGEAAGGNHPPTVSFAQPLDGQVFDAGVNLDVVDDADDPDGSVANVKLYLDGQWVRREGVWPYEWSASEDAVFKNMAPGTYTLTAKATDDLGAIAQASASITVD